MVGKVIFKMGTYPRVYLKFFFELFEIAILFYLLKSIKICF